MKKLKILILALTFIAMNVSAAVINPVMPSAKLRAEIVELIGNDCPFEFDKDACVAEVLFTINYSGEIVIISVTSKNTDADAYIKRKLNYKKVSHKVDKEGELYLLPLRIVEPS